MSDRSTGMKQPTIDSFIKKMKKNHDKAINKQSSLLG